jgi:alkylation response protein AidB-like acyl-CoA dehydrogenase
MASPAELVRTVSAATGVPLPTIVDIDRRLVKGRLRTKGGRGFNAAQMAPLDAARLLTGMLASAQANAAADAAERYAQTRVDTARSSDKLFGTVGLDDLAALPARHSFVDALTALIASASTGSLAKLITTSKKGWTPNIEVFAFTRAARGRIRIAGLPNGMTASVEYAAMSAGTKASRASKIDPSRAATNDTVGDLEQSRRVTERTILPIAALLAPGEPK